MLKIKKPIYFARYKKRLIALVQHPFFWVLTIAGNSIIVIGSMLLYTYERILDGVELEYIDCLLWSVGLVTTVGYGNYTPQTFVGKITVLALMFTGTLFLWTYMGFLVTGLIAPELSSLDREVHEVEKEIQDLKKKA